MYALRTIIALVAAPLCLFGKVFAESVEADSDDNLSALAVPLKKLIDLLKNFKKQCRADAAKEKAMFEEFGKWCQKEIVK